MSPDAFREKCELAVQTSRKLMQQAAALCETSRGLIDSSFQLMEADDRKRSRTRMLLERLDAIRHKHNGEAFLAILDLAVQTSEADFGNIQVYDASAGALRIVAQQGFGEEFLRYFEVVHTGTGTCGAALQKKSRVIVSDVANHPIFSGECREVLLRANARACQSTPLISSSGNLVGMLNTHYRTPRRPPAVALPYLDLLAERSAELL